MDAERSPDPGPADDPPAGLDPDGEPLERPVADDGTELSEYAHPEIEIPQETVQSVRRPSTVGGVVYLLVLAATLTGVVIAGTGRWRVGLVLMGCAVLGGAVVRAVLPESQTGMLHVRRRLVDVFILVVLGGSLLVSALSIPR